MAARVERVALSVSGGRADGPKGHERSTHGKTSYVTVLCAWSAGMSSNVSAWLSGARAGE